MPSIEDQGQTNHVTMYTCTEMHHCHISLQPMTSQWKPTTMTLNQYSQDTAVIQCPMSATCIARTLLH